MAEDVQIGTHSRRFRFAVLVAALFVLLAALLAIAALDANPTGIGSGGANPFAETDTPQCRTRLPVGRARER